MNTTVCPVCGDGSTTPTAKLTGVPVLCNVLHPDRESALAAPRADLDLHLCGACGHLFNTSFDPRRTVYDDAYENPLHHSRRFRDYAASLASDLDRSYSLREGPIIEAGCGQGDFLRLLVEVSGGRGVGFDPAFRDADGRREDGNVVIHPRAFDSGAAALPADPPSLLICRHVLEHVPDPVGFLDGLRRALPPNIPTPLYLEVPDGMFSLRDGGLWDLIYEHVSYFNARSLALCCSRAGFAPRRARSVFGGQFLALDAAAATARTEGEDPRHWAPAPEEMLSMAAAMSSRLERETAVWRRRLAELEAAGGRAVVWGAGSKGVTFLNLVDPGAAVAHLVDLNPAKHGRCIPGTGHVVTGPGELSRTRPRLVIVMNPLYGNEIAAELEARGVTARMIGVGEDGQDMEGEE